MATMEVLGTDRLVLEPLAERHMELLVRIDGDPEVMRFLTGGAPAPTSEATAAVRAVREGRYRRWVAFERATGAPIGWFALRPTGRTRHELGYRLARSQWDRGLATEGAREMLRLAFDDLGAERVWARTMVVNGRSRRVLDRLGLRHTWTAHLHWNESIGGSEHGDAVYDLDRRRWDGPRGRVLHDTRTVTPGILRPATTADLPGIRHTYLRAWRAGYVHLLSRGQLDREAARREQHDWHDWEGAIDSTGTDGARHVTVASDATGRTIGVIEVALPPAATAPEVTMLYVEPGVWGTGVATVLLMAGMHWLAEHGATSARLFTAAPPTRARGFYEREGWIPDAAGSGAPTGLFPLVCYRRALR